jgi:small subunit ribosomal protein S16
MQRFGRRHRPFSRNNAIAPRTRRNGRVIESLGCYDPVARDESKQLELKTDRIKHWLSVGAQPSETVRTILAHHDLIDKTQWEADRKARRDLIDGRRAAAAAAAATDENAHG